MVRRGGLFEEHASFISGDYHDEMNFENVSKLVREMLIPPDLPPNCVIVLDNAPYQSVQMNNPPTLMSRK
jgi:hypothetical protein